MDVAGERFGSWLPLRNYVQSWRQYQPALNQERRERFILFDQKKLNRTINKGLQKELLNRKWKVQDG